MLGGEESLLRELSFLYSWRRFHGKESSPLEAIITGISFSLSPLRRIHRDSVQAQDATEERWQESSKKSLDTTFKEISGSVKKEKQQLDDQKFPLKSLRKVSSLTAERL
jgi:hypothetical protein